MFKIRCDGVVPMMDALSTDNDSASMDSVVPDEDSSNDEYVEVVTKRNAVNKSEKQVKTNKRTKKRNNTKYKKERNEPMYTIIKQTSYFPPESMCKLTGWHLYKIKVANYDYFGFIVPCILGKIPPFTFPRNNVESIVKVEYVEPINYNKYKDQFEKFCRYIFEEDFTDMNTGPEAILKFDIESSPFKLLPCLLTNLGSIDYRQMHLICSKTNRLDQNLQEIDDDDDDVDVQSSSSVVQFHACLPQIISSKRKAVQRMSSKRSNTGTCEYFDKTTIMTATKEDDICYSHEKSTIKDEQSTLQSSHAPLPVSDRDISNHKKSQFAPELPKILDLISQVFYKNKLRELLIDATGSHSTNDLDGMSPVTFTNSLPTILSSPNVLPLTSLSHDLVSENNCGLHPKFDLLFQATTCHLADENSNMENLETLGDSFLKTTSLSVSYQCPVGEDKKLTVERDKHVAMRISVGWLAKKVYTIT
ncbi:hypothetical protein I4U23_029585 [Adineta vaga]|nr:hypothetical protein I4U23_029585 [Adineta vaga]